MHIRTKFPHDCTSLVTSVGYTGEGMFLRLCICIHIQDKYGVLPRKKV